MRKARAFRRLTVCLRCVACRLRRRAGRVLEDAHRFIATVRDRLLGLDEIGPQPLLEAQSRFVAQRETFSCSLQAVERPERGLAATRGVRKLVLRLAPLLE